MKTAIYSLLRAAELDRARHMINQCLPSLDDRCHLFIWINDGVEARAVIKALRQSCDSRLVFFLAGNRNHGVAGGRNRVLRHCLALGYEFFISCDNDIVFDRDYLRQLRLSHEALQSADSATGLIQPVLLDGRRVKRELGLEGISGWQQLVNSSWVSPDLAPLLGDLLGRSGDAKLAGLVHHAGVSNVWRAHFDGGAPIGAWLDSGAEGVRDAGSMGTDEPIPKNDPAFLSAALRARQPFQTVTTAGGISAFHRRVIDAIGFYDERFNPFGYEDSEFGLRAALAGFKNWVVPGVVAVHDPYFEANNRSLLSHATIGRLRGVELSLLPPDSPLRPYARCKSFLHCWEVHAAQIGSASVAGEIAPRQIPDVSFRFFLSYVLNFVYGRFGNSTCDFQRSNRLFDLLLPSRFEGWNSDALEVDLGRGVFLRGSIPEVRLSFDALREQILAISVANLRLEVTGKGQGALRSRYADVYLTLRQSAADRLVARLNIQANDQTVSWEAQIEIGDFLRSGLKEAPSIVESQWRAHAYDLGQFSPETLYPEPDISRANWLTGELDEICRRIRDSGGAFDWLLRALRDYVVNGKIADTTSEPAVCGSSSTEKRRKILLFTDSRGQHKAVGAGHDMFGDRLANTPSLEVDQYLCPMKWTTTSDFLEMFDESRLSAYDTVILWTGIVEWSPRPMGSAWHDLYDNPNSANLENLSANTNQYSKKVVNNKRGMLDSIFGAERMHRHLSTPLESMYSGERTCNLYSLEMAECMIERLSAIPNLVFISANRFVRGWDGDYTKGRPANMDLTHAYSDLFAERLRQRVRVVDLRVWTDQDILRHTTDNIHLTASGNEWIFQQLLNICNEGLLTGVSGSGVSVPSGSSQAVASSSTALLVREISEIQPSESLLVTLFSVSLLEDMDTAIQLAEGSPKLKDALLAAVAGADEWGRASRMKGARGMLLKTLAWSSEKKVLPAWLLPT